MDVKIHTLIFPVQLQTLFTVTCLFYFVWRQFLSIRKVSWISIMMFEFANIAFSIFDLVWDFSQPSIHLQHYFLLFFCFRSAEQEITADKLHVKNSKIASLCMHCSHIGPHCSCWFLCWFNSVLYREFMLKLMPTYAYWQILPKNTTKYHALQLNIKFIVLCHNELVQIIKRFFTVIVFGPFVYDHAFITVLYATLLKQIRWEPYNKLWV